MATDELLIERLLRVIDEGQRTATYKLALLLGMIDAIASTGSTTDIPTRAIAERVLELYYPQTRPFAGGDGSVIDLRQIGLKNSEVLTVVTALRRAAEAAKCRTLHDVRAALPLQYEATVDAVENTFVRYPIPLLQVVGRQVVPFLYEVEWPEGTSLKTLRAKKCDRVRLLDGVGDRLVVLGPMIRPLIETHWARDVMRWSRIDAEDEHVREHLFGRERVGFPKALVGELAELQGNTCFYCGDALTSGRQVDHFVPWSRYANDAVENLVVADRCNTYKSSHLAATEHLARWRARLDHACGDLITIAERSKWPTDRQRTWSLTRMTYAHLSAGTPLWIRAGDFELVSGPMLASE